MLISIIMNLLEERDRAKEKEEVDEADEFAAELSKWLIIIISVGIFAFSCVGELRNQDR